MQPFEIECDIRNNFLAAFRAALAGDGDELDIVLEGLSDLQIDLLKNYILDFAQAIRDEMNIRGI